MTYSDIDARLKSGGVVILDGGTGTELERRGLDMNPEAWCGTATIENTDMLVDVHLDYIRAGAEIVTANTYASSRLMLEAAGYGDKVEEINRTAVEAALRAREIAARDKSGRDVLVAGSLSHMAAIVPGSATYDPDNLPPPEVLSAAFTELAGILKDAGCDLILLELLYDPYRIPLVMEAAFTTGLPVWLGLGARRGGDGPHKGQVLSFDQNRDIPFAEIAAFASDPRLTAAGVMHSYSNVTGDALAILRENFDGPLTAYPDSGYFEMPSWQFDDIIPPAEFAAYARDWVDQGAQVLGGCCGLSPEHIAALAPFRK